MARSSLCRLPAAAGLILLLPALTGAQTSTQRPDFSGRWTIVRERCVPPQPSGEVTVQTGIPNRLDITVADNVLTVAVRKELRGGALQRYTETITIDGEPHPFEHEGGKGTISARWDRMNNLILTRQTEMTMGERTMSMSQEETWSIGEVDGMTVLAMLIQPPGRPGAGQPGAGGRPPAGGRGGRPGGGGRGAFGPVVLAFQKRR